MIVLVILLTSPSPDYKWSPSWPSLHQSLAPQWWKYSGDANNQPVTKLSWTLAFLQKTLSKQTPTSETWVIFQVYEKFAETAKGIICGGLSIGQFSCVRPPPRPSQCQMIIIRDKFYLSALFQIYPTRRKGSWHFFVFFLHSTKMVKIFIGNLPDGGLVSLKKNPTNQYFWTDPI